MPPSPMSQLRGHVSTGARGSHQAPYNLLPFPFPFPGGGGGTATPLTDAHTLSPTLAGIFLPLNL